MESIELPFSWVLEMETPSMNQYTSFPIKKTERITSIYIFGIINSKTESKLSLYPQYAKRVAGPKTLQIVPNIVLNLGTFAPKVVWGNRIRNILMIRSNKLYRRNEGLSQGT